MSTLEPANVSPMPPGVTDPNYKPLSGRLGNLTVMMQHALDSLKKQLMEEGILVEERMDDAFLLRFLRARKFDVAKTKAMLISEEQWRKEFGVDDLAQNFDFKEKILVDKLYPQYYHKMDKEGRPLFVERLGQLDIKQLYQVTTQDRLLQRLIYEYEKFLVNRIPACSRAAGHPVETSCTILDLGGVTLANFYRVRDFVSQAAKIGQDRYPETMGKFYIINAPWAFQAVWSVIRPWLDEVTVNKITILDHKYREKLLEQIPEENLPKEFGGTCACPGGCSLSDAGPWNPAVVPNTGESA